jgi:hypothetical protein
MFNWLIGSKEIEERDFTIKFELENNKEPQELNNLPRNYGVYQVNVEPVNDPTAPSGIFMIGRINKENYCGQVVRIISAKGEFNGQLDMCWPANKFPHLQYRPTNYTETEELKELYKRLELLKKEHNRNFLTGNVYVFPAVAPDYHSTTEYKDIEEKRLELFKNLPKVEYKLRFIGV